MIWKKLFEKYGKITKIAFRQNKERRGYGFVTYEERAFAQAAIDGLKGHRIDGDSLTLDFDVGLDRKKKIRPYHNHYNNYHNYNNYNNYHHRDRGHHRYNNYNNRRHSRSRSPVRRRRYSRSPRRSPSRRSRSRSPRSSRR